MARLSLAFLGTFQVTLDSQPITRFRSNRNAGLLVYLAMQSDRSFPREVLATLFWPDESDSNARNNLRQAVYQLRKVLGDSENEDASHLLVTRQTIQFNGDSDFTLDVNHFWRSIDGGDPEAAVAVYHGDLLPGFICDSLPFEDWLRHEREQLHQSALEAMSAVTRGHLQAGRPDKAQALARQQLILEPWRESACRQLMKAYALNGDRSNALAQYEQCREVLWEELGVEPAAETTALYESIKKGDFGPVAAETSLEAPRDFRHNLPVYASAIVGREAELQALDASMADPGARLVTIVGPGGIGKTRLAVAAAGRILDARLFSEGVFYIDLTRLRETNRILPALADALDFPFAGEDDPSARRQFLHYLSQKKMLLVMDNFEHLLDGAELVADILQAAPAVHFLVTSRERLKLRLEQVYPIDGLAFSDMETTGDAAEHAAVVLFLQAAQRNRPDFALRGGQDLTHLARICRLVEGMPLALELAASWVDVLTLDEISRELQRGLDILATELRDVPERQRSVEACFNYTWRTLDEAERVIFAQLSIFRGGFTRAAAQEVPGASLRQLSNLVSKSLIRFDTGRNRYEIHELLRQFGAEKLGAQPELEARTSERHSIYYLQFLAGLTDELRGKGQQQAIAAVDADLDNVLLAWDRASAHQDIEAIGISLESLWRYYMHLGIRELPAFERAAADLRQGETTGARGIVLGRLLAPLGRSHGEMGDAAKARETLEESLALLRRLGAREESLVPLMNLAHVQESIKASNQLFREGLALAREIDDRWYVGHAQLFLGWNARLAGDYDEAEQNLHKALEQFRQNGDDGSTLTTLASLSRLATDRGRYVEALSFAGESLSLAEGFIGLAPQLGRASMARALYALGEYEQAEALARQALRVEREFGGEYPDNWLMRLGELAFARKEYARAARLFEEGLAAATKIQDLEVVISAQLALGGLSLRQGNMEEARRRLRSALHSAVRLDRRPLLLDCLALSAELLAAEGDPLHAARLAWLVTENPASRAMTKERGERLLTLIEKEPSSDEMDVIRLRDRMSDVGTVAARLLSELEAP